MKKVCAIDECTLPASVHGYCWGHDKQIKRGVAIHPVTPRKHPIGSQVPWLHAHVNHAGDECLKWPFASYKDGRGQVTIDKRTLQSHRVMCELAHGKPPTLKHEAAHSCGKGHEGCVNPKHLRWATHAENVADKELHGTVIRGEKCSSAILTESRVIAIREFAHTCSTKTIADLFGLRVGHVQRVVSRQTWRHVA